jgi:hypothetical protein
VPYYTRKEWAQIKQLSEVLREKQIAEQGKGSPFYQPNYQEAEAQAKKLLGIR